MKGGDPFTNRDLKVLFPRCTRREALARATEALTIGRATSLQQRAAWPAVPKAVKAKGPDTVSRKEHRRTKKHRTPAVSNIFDLGAL